MRAGLGGLATYLIVLTGVGTAFVRTVRLVNVCQDGIQPVTFRHVTPSIQVCCILSAELICRKNPTHVSNANLTITLIPVAGAKDVS